ncbi:tRNA (cytidine(34)-2'-O)-methyltransferase [Geitlerinema sp. PCC 9228]|jgi:tRNA (cytidine/uridine-2'-O-)-methyltransferase|uniref:tRNA (cytidine(34)-2'-O)-methyltransferase n=1 Tax=Geitlerinema sp. PCC 9228 TaxID=111611 RepID=UPI0008F9BCFD|nr:tRNA (cytidine(34)-2'-O)-methyltransferase [Geitlerinema sp. PCC 9228]
MPQVVLVEPQIPPNTGSVGRTCAASKTVLHLVGPLGFEISDRALKRAGLDYWPYLQWHYHPTMAAFAAYHQKQSGRWIGFSTRGSMAYHELTYQPTDWLLFGSETVGLSSEVLATCDVTAYIPIDHPQVRSLNLSVSVAIGLFEARRQLGWLPRE